MQFSVGSMFMLLSVSLMSGCSGFRAPAISVDEVVVTEVTDEAVALAFAIDLHNPNDTALQLHEFRYTLAIDGTQVYTGRRAPDAALTAAATQRVMLPAVIPYHRLGWTAEAHPEQARFALSGKLVYLVPSTFAKILFDSGVRRPKSSFSERGTIILTSP
jgi:LEA14-like dessication related protein